MKTTSISWKLTGFFFVAHLKVMEETQKGLKMLKALREDEATIIVHPRKLTWVT